MASAAKLQAGMNSTGPPLRASMRSRVLTTTSSAVASPSRRPTRSSDPGSPDMGERRWDVMATFVKLRSTQCAPARGSLAHRSYGFAARKRRAGRLRGAALGRSVFEKSRRATVVRQSTDLEELRGLEPIVFLLHVLRLLGVWLRHDFLQLSN